MVGDVEARIARLNAPVCARLSRLFSGSRRPFEVYGLLSEFLSMKGKLLRPALCLAACQAVGGKRSAAAPAAAAIEMFHNFTLIHDDIEDCSKLRRGKPCLHIKYGLPLALNAGDGLFMMVWREALLIPGKERELAQQRLLSAFTKVLEGQAIELGWYWKNDWDVDEAEYYQVVGGKTGALIAGACEVGGIVGGADERQRKLLYDFGMGIGIGFQMMDDALNIVGDEKKYGKEIGGDILEGKRTLITIRALRNLRGGRRRLLAALLKKDSKSSADVKAVVALLKESGAVDEVVVEARKTISNAVKKLSSLPDTKNRQLLVELAAYITERSR
jgi:geranylgeranyl diphosphate synthase type I